MKILLIEDDTIWRLKLQDMLDELKMEIIASVDSVGKAIEKLENNKPDLIIADVILGMQKAFDIFNNNKKFCKIPTIFITQSNKEVYYKASELVEKKIYLVKPFHTLTLRSCINSLISKEKTDLEKTLTIKGKHNSKIHLPLHQIAYLEQIDHYCHIHTTLQKELVVQKTLKAVIDDLDDRFIQVHRSYCINKNEIVNFSTGLTFVKLKTKEIPIGSSYKEKIKEIIANSFLEN